MRTLHALWTALTVIADALTDPTDKRVVLEAAVLVRRLTRATTPDEAWSVIQLWRAR